MRTDFTKGWNLQKAGEVFSGALPAGGMLQVLQGDIWLTVEGELDDYFLHEGEVCALPAQRLIVIEAQNHGARYCVQAMAGASVLHPQRQALAA
ncbi:DUF2917 domain-containing protein [Massilia sp. W12]|uniref:DUF2917 domain-containing protein n=1 Tax=Massilia sp. W12 TaxID=3126507 RepID=UPI0030CAA575